MRKVLLATALFVVIVLAAGKVRGRKGRKPTHLRGFAHS